MRFLLSTVAATALMASPALAQTLENDAAETPEAADPMGQGIDFGQLEQDLTGAGFTDASELRGAEVYTTRYQGEQALVIIMDEELDDVAGFDDPAVDDDLAEAPDPAIDDDLAEAPDDPAIDDDLAETPDDPAMEEDFAEAPDDPAIDDDLAETPDDPAIDDELAEAPEDPAVDPDIDDPDVTAAVPGVGVEDELGQAGFEMPERTDQGQVFRTTTEDGRTMLIVMGYDAAATPGIDDPAEPGLDPAEPEMDPAEPDLEELD